jgi:rsbT co-antagonist protein RsbR
VVIVVDLQKENEALKQKLADYEHLIGTMSAPVIETVLKNVLLVPLTGVMTLERINNIDDAIFHYISKVKQAECMIIDFTGIVVDDFSYIDAQTLTNRFKRLIDILALMGIRVIYTGMNPDVVRYFYTHGFVSDNDAFSSFRSAIHQLLKEGYSAHT